MGYHPDKDMDKPKPEPRTVLRKAGQATRHRTFPIRREKPGGKTEFQVYIGFDRQEDAEGWIDNMLSCGHLKQPKGLAKGSPARP